MNISGIILHHSLTKDSHSVSWGAIRRYHTQTLGWIDIGYHFGIENVGGHYEVLMGRMPHIIGAHCKGQNKRTLGICFVGNFDNQEPPEKQWCAGLKLVRWLLYNYRLIPSDVHGHNAFANKTCPGTEFSIEKFRAEIHMGGI